MKKYYLMLFLLALSLSACSISPGTVTPTQTPTMELPFFPRTGNTVFFDDFEVNDGIAWSLVEAPEQTAKIEDGQLLLQVNQPNWLLWTTSGNVSTADIVVQVDSTTDSGQETSTQGIICRFVDNNNFYSLSVARNGYVEIVKTKDGQPTYLFADVVSRTIIHPKENNLTVTCIGDTLAIYANQYFLASAKDTDIPSGDVGLIAGTIEDETFAVHFDNFIALTPEQTTP